MAIKGKDLLNLLTPGMPFYLNILMVYLVLHEKLREPEKQSWYFRRGLVANQQRLKRLQADFEMIREHFNACSVDDLLTERNEKQKHLDYILSKPGIGLLLQIAYRSSRARINYLDDMIALKSSVAVLHEAAHYLTHTTDFLQLADWDNGREVSP